MVKTCGVCAVENHIMIFVTFLPVLICLSLIFVLYQEARKELLQLDFEGILKHFRVTMPKKYMDEERYKQLFSTALGIKVCLEALQKIQNHCRKLYYLVEFCVLFLFKS